MLDLQVSWLISQLFSWIIIHSFCLLNVIKWWKNVRADVSRCLHFCPTASRKLRHIGLLFKNWNQLTLLVKQLINGLIIAAHCTCRQKKSIQLSSITPSILHIEVCWQVLGSSMNPCSGSCGGNLINCLQWYYSVALWVIQVSRFAISIAAL